MTRAEAFRGTPERWLVLAASPRSQLEAEAVTQVMIDLGGRAVWESEGRLLTHLPGPTDPGDALAALKDRLPEAAGSQIELETWWQPHADWAEVWKRGLAPRRIADRLVVTPTWCDPVAKAGDLVLRLDPGMAFGTAEHGTTRGCLRLLCSAVRGGDRVLDVGAGSGILSIAAVLLGAAESVAVDGDPYAIEAVLQNATLNGVGPQVRPREAWLTAANLQAFPPREGVVANIETAVLRDLLPGLRAATAAKGWLILGGIVDRDLDGFVVEVEATGLSLARIDAEGEWRSVLFQG